MPLTSERRVDLIVTEMAVMEPGFEIILARECDVSRAGVG
ncbi:hypothetical protein AAW51_0374 [Caldimonas brevitalea]|uniref:Uncharacterized protein n=1 Tax=Caldimonas brevitalea TaxID=413882 RepID=A0A0G3BKJ2_9BURK|nr:hypothetical protein AAW51_0374 [Caldimonas brevitalea]